MTDLQAELQSGLSGKEAFDGDPAAVAIVRAQIYGWRGDGAESRAWGDSAQRYYAQQLHETPNDAQRHVIRGLALAYAGQRDEAVAEGERGWRCTRSRTTRRVAPTSCTSSRGSTCTPASRRKRWISSRS